MEAEKVTLNPVGEDPTKAPLDFVGLDPSWGIYLLAHDYPPPAIDTEHAENSDGDGDPVIKSRWKNRTITHRLRLFEPTDAAGTNLAKNPSAELDTTSWSLSSGSFTAASLARELWNTLIYKKPGTDYAFRIKGTKDNTATERFLILETQEGVNGMPVVAGKKYAFSFDVYGADVPSRGVGANNILMEVTWYKASGEQISSPSTQKLLNQGEIARLSAIFESPALAAFAKIRIVGWTTTALDVVDLWIDRVQFEQAEAATNYFDGDTPGCTWSGARHGSSSARPAPGGPRYNAIAREVTEQIDRIKRQKVGTLRRIAPGANPLTYDLLSASVTDAPQDIGVGMWRSEIGLSFEARPGGREPEELLVTKEELTLPVLSMLVEGVRGDMPALGRLRLTDLSGVPQQTAWWGLQQQFYSAAASAELFYEAESRTPISPAATAALAGASGGGNNTILHGSLVNEYQGVVSTQASGGGAHLSLIGSFRVLARIHRPASNQGEVSVKWAWSQGDFVNVEENDPITFGANEREGMFTIEDLGTMTIEKAPAGATQRCEGRLMAKSNFPTDDIYVDWIWLIPTDEGSGEVTGSNNFSSTSLLGFDSFVQTAGALAAKNADVGGAWAGAGDADDFVETGSPTFFLQRTAVSDASGVGRYALLGASEPTDVAVGVTHFATPVAGMGTYQCGVIARYVDTNNWVAALVVLSGLLSNTFWRVQFKKKVAGVVSTLAISTILTTAGEGTLVTMMPELTVTSFGYWELRNAGVVCGSGIDTDMGAAGALKKGKVGIYDEYPTAGAFTRNYDNFKALVPVVDMAMFANRSFEVQDDQALREDSAGLTWGKAPYEGNYILVPPAGPEKAISRITAKGSRNPESDAGIDDLKAQLWVTPRRLLGPPT